MNDEIRSSNPGIARGLVRSGLRVGVYKPVASGCRLENGLLLADDAIALWHAAGQPLTLDAVCPQRFRAPLAPHLAAREEGRVVCAERLVSGLETWKGQCDVVLVEGAGGLPSPVADDTFVADIAAEMGYPLVVVASNKLGVINQTLQTLVVAATFRDGLEVAGLVLNDARPVRADDPSMSSNADQLAHYCIPPLLCHVGHDDSTVDFDWAHLLE